MSEELDQVSAKPWQALDLKPFSDERRWIAERTMERVYSGDITEEIKARVEELGLHRPEVYVLVRGASRMAVVTAQTENGYGGTRLVVDDLPAESLWGELAKTAVDKYRSDALRKLEYAAANIAVDIKLMKAATPAEILRLRPSTPGYSPVFNG